MKIPSGVNHLQFWQAATKQGVKIESRYLGVMVSINGGRPFWLVRVQKEGKNLFHKRFPFTEDGEKTAGLLYAFYFSFNKINPREGKKRKKRSVVVKKNLSKADS